MVLRMGETRPRDFSPQELGFTPQRAVPWLNPRLLAGTGVRTLFSDLFGAYLDKREMQAVLGENRHDYSAADELWIDYTADVGDGFDATYSIASLIARPTLEVPGPDGSPHVLPAVISWCSAATRSIRRRPARPMATDGRARTEPRCRRRPRTPPISTRCRATTTGTTG